MISRIEKWDINKYENEGEEDIEMNDYSQNKANKNSIKRNTKKDENQSPITENLNQKYNFRKGEINYSDIVFNKDKKKLRFNMMVYFKSPGDYNAIRYFSCGNYNKKSKKGPLNKICEGKIKIDLTKETAEITKLHTNECLKKSFGQITIMPSLNEEITKIENIL